MRKYLILFLIVFTAVTGYYFFRSQEILPLGERFIYPLDDAYIHLAIAKNFALHGAWSVNSSGFDSSSSSILYTLLLSVLIKIFGNWEYYPLIINIVFGYATIYAVYRYFRDFYGKLEMKWAIVLLLPFTLLYVMVLIGMEHTLHIFFMVVAIYLIQRNVTFNFRRRDFVQLLFVVFLISITRFESMFFTVSLSFALFLRKDILKGALVMIFGFWGIVLFGLISMHYGGFFFPNSVIIKGAYPAGNNFFSDVFRIFRKGILLNPSFYKCLFFPFLIIAIYLFKKYSKKNTETFFRKETLIITIVSTAIIHSLFTILKYRYENYVMTSVLLIFIPIISDFFKNSKLSQKKFSVLNIGFLIGFFGIVAVSGYRFWFMHVPNLVGAKNIYEQQVEMSRFLAKNYRGEKIVANDIGAISYFSEVKLLDMVGLGSTDVAKMIVQNKHLNNDEFQKKYRDFLIHYISNNGYQVAVIYPKWFPVKTPASWIPIASWKIQERKTSAMDRVVFYALRPEEIKPLQQNLMKFDLNKNVEQWFYILKKK